MDGIIEIFFAHTSASSRFFIHCFVLLSLALKNLFSKAKVKEWDDVFLHRYLLLLFLCLFLGRLIGF